MLRFLAEFLIGLIPLAIICFIEHFFTKVPPGRMAKKKLQRLIERNRKFEEAKE